ncbi:MAG: glycosyltransferase [Pseudomonadota bacterium]
MIWLALSVLAILSWGFLLTLHGGFWRADQRLRPAPDPADWPEVAVIIPARDEAETIFQVIASHQKSDYPGALSIFLIDDHSSDETAVLAREGAALGERPVHIVSPPELEEGWTGKLWAVHHGLRAARETAPDAAYVLMTDADIAHAPDALRRLVARAERDDLALTSLMATLDTRGFWGALLIPAFVFFFQKLYPFPWANDPNRYLAAAAGGCMLVRRDALRDEGGVAAIRGELIDDCALAALLKGEPPKRRIWLGHSTGEVVSLRDNRSLDSVWNMVARTAYTQLNHSLVFLAGSLIGLFVVYLAGPLAMILWPLHGYGLAAAAGFIAWALMARAYRPTSSLYRRIWPEAFGLPLAAALYMAMTASSAWRWMRGRGGEWKGRVRGGTDGASAEPQAAE